MDRRPLVARELIADRLVAMLTDAVGFLVGLAALVFGADMMVRGGAEVAARFGISPIVIGLTVVSIGTSMPELAIGVVSAREGSGAHQNQSKEKKNRPGAHGVQVSLRVFSAPRCASAHG